MKADIVVFAACFCPSGGLLCCCATRANSNRCCHWRNVRLRDEFLWRSPSDFWCLREKTWDWEVRFWVSSIRLVRHTGLLHSSMLGAILPAIKSLKTTSDTVIAPRVAQVLTFMGWFAERPNAEQVRWLSALCIPIHFCKKVTSQKLYEHKYFRVLIVSR